MTTSGAIDAIKRARRAVATLVEDMRVNRRGADIAVAEQLLHRPDVVSGREQMGGERMPERVAADRLGDSGQAFWL